MTKVQVVADDGRVMYMERIQAEDFDAQLFRDSLAERIGWAAADAQDQEPHFEHAAGAGDPN